MRRRDLLNPSPSERAEFLYNHLQLIKPTIWDMVCFAGELLTVASEDLPAMRPYVKEIISSIYTAHYNVTEPFASAIAKHSVQQDERSGESAQRDTRPTLTLMRQNDEREEPQPSNGHRNDNHTVGGITE